VDKIPAVGGARGLFEIFVPGLFLLLNLVGTVYFLPFTDDVTKRQISAFRDAPTLALLVGIPFGYLAGVVLRLFRTDMSDRASAAFLRLYDRNAKGGERDNNRYAYEGFPYSRWFSYLTEHRLPQAAHDFYKSVWLGCPSKQFLNFCKIVVSSSDPAAAAEIYSAESLSRYVSGMFYALAISFVLLSTLLTARLSAGVEVGIALPVLTAAYGAGLLAILANFRFIRIKEVETIFAACFKNRDLFLASVGQPKLGDLTQEGSTGGKASPN
jgi:hypothetical protein